MARCLDRMSSRRVTMWSIRLDRSTSTLRRRRAVFCSVGTTSRFTNSERPASQAKRRASLHSLAAQ